jgi:hypothetical protein
LRPAQGGTDTRIYRADEGADVDGGVRQLRIDPIADRMSNTTSRLCIVGANVVRDFRS